MLRKKMQGQFESQAPAYKYIDSQRNIGYKPRTALGDLCDNSIDANAANIWVDFKTEKRGADKEITEIYIADDGHGMDPDTLCGSYKLGYDRPRTKNQLGKFGVGGTIGSLSLASKKLTITRDANGIAARSYDLAEVQKYDEWGSQVVTVEPWMTEKLNDYVGASNPGTLIILSDLDKLTMKKKKSLVQSLDNYFSQIYCQLIAADQICLWLDSKGVSSKDPIYFYHRDAIVLRDEVIPETDMRLRVVNVKSIVGELEGGVRAQGGYVFRCNRLIETRVVNNDTWQSLWNFHPNYRHVRWALYYEADMDEAMGTSAQKDGCNPLQSIRDKVGQRIMEEASPIAKADRRKNKKVSKKEKEASLKRLNDVINSLPKKVQFEVAATSQTKDSKVVSIDRKIREAPLPVPTYTIQEDRLGGGSEFAIIGINPDETQSKHLIRINLDHPFMVQHYNNASEVQRQAIFTFTVSWLLTTLRHGESTTFDMDEFKRDLSSNLNAVTRKL